MADRGSPRRTVEPTDSRPLNGGRRRRIVLVTSGLGPALGGVGVVSRMMVSALEPVAKVTIWRHYHTRSQIHRVASLLAKASWGALSRPDLVLYEHNDLARIHALSPTLRSIPHAVFLHGTDVWRSLGPGLRKKTMLAASLLMANSATTVDWARKANPWLPDVRVVWLGLPGGRVEGRGPASDPVALIVGRIDSTERRKGHDLILDAWPEICRAVPEARLIVAGNGDDLPRLRRRVEQECLSGVEFKGWVSDAERDSLYRSSRLFLFPSRQEGFGLAAVEAAAAGVPVLGLRGTVLEEVFPQGRGAVLADEPTGGSIAAAAIPLLADLDRARSVGAAASARVHETFLETHFAHRLREALAPWLASKSG